MPTDFYGFEDDEPRSQGKDYLFLWTVFILLLIGLAFGCWLGSFYIFGHPEQPRSYALLKKMHKIEPLKRFEVTAAPTGEFLTPQKLFERYSKFERLQLDAVNAELLRNYIKNYKETKELVPYVTGRFEIVETYELKPTDLFPSGVVAVGVASEYSQVVIEHVFTTPAESVAALKASLPVGLDIRLERARDPVAVVHVEWTDDGRLMFTAMPLLYGTWGVKGGINSFSLEPPESINLKAGAPIVKAAAFAEMMTRFAAAGHAHPVATAEGETPVHTEPELVRVDSTEPGKAVPETGAMRPVTVATPIPVAVATPRGRATPPVLALRSTPTVLAMRSTPWPLATPRFAVNSTPAVVAPPVMPATPLPVAPPSVPPVASLVTPKMPPPGVIKPFVGSAPVAMQGGNWRTYQRGQQPPGRSITPAEASRMADRGGEIAERLYLRGDFVVTAAGDNRAVLRAPATLGEPSREGVTSTRILVEFPPSAELPSVGSTLSRGEAEGFEVREVRRGQDGQVNIFVREITRGG